MYQIIASTLFQNKICRLPGIGTLVMITHPAQSDFINNRIKSPVETIDFIAEENDDNGFNEFTAMSELLQKNLDQNGNFLLKGIGTFIKTVTSEIQFTPIPIDPVLMPSIPVKRVIRQDESHALLVGDQQTTNLQMSGYFNGKQPVKDRWWVWAIVLGAIGIIALLFYIYKYGWRAFGNINY